MAKLHQILAVRKGLVDRTTKGITQLHRQTEAIKLVSGLERTYQPLSDSGQAFPPERNKVQVRSEEALKALEKYMAALFEVEAQVDWANTEARADIIVDGHPILTNVPATHLLFLSKQMDHLRTFVTKMAELDPGEDWGKDSNSGLFKTEPTKTHRTAKVQRPIVKYDATTEHPAQTEMITEDQIIGHWIQTRFSGAISRPQKIELLERIEELARAVKFAEGQANLIDVSKQNTKVLLDFVFRGEM